MKLIILEGGDRLGKSTLIEGLCKHFNYDNISIRHFGKPPKKLDSNQVLLFQFICFSKEAEFIDAFKFIGADNYYDNIIIWNRSHLGEYVYSQMFRGVDGEEIKNQLTHWEHFKLLLNNEDIDMHLITLTADPEFFLSKEDGESFSKNLEEKTKELQLFKEAHEFSLIKNKLLIKVDNNGEFKSKEEILNEVLNFIK